MAMLQVDHPDIMDFIKIKSDLSVLNNFNISVAVTDAFMDAVENDEEYDLINPRSNEPVKKQSAVKVFRQIVKQAWFSGEPGIHTDRRPQWHYRCYQTVLHRRSPIYPGLYDRPFNARLLAGHPVDPPLVGHLEAPAAGRAVGQPLSGSGG